LVQDARILADVERRGVHANDRHLSVSSWVAAEFRTGYSEAARDVRVARALEDMPATRDALTEGEVSSSAVGILMSAKETNPEAFSTGWSITGSGCGWATQGRCSPGRTGP
jgi:hypothetical protein